jgi:hypothetical protein
VKWARRQTLAVNSPLKWLDGVLQPELVRRGEDRGHAELEAEADDPPEDIGARVGPLEARIVVELRVGRAAVRLPVGGEAGQDGVRRRALERPRAGQPAAHRHRREHVEQRPARELEVLDHVDRVHLRRAGRHGRQVPARRRGRPPHPVAPVDGAVPNENPGDGALRRDGLAPAARPQSCPHRRRAVLPQHARRA